MPKNCTSVDLGSLALARYVKQKGISMVAVSKNTGISIGKLQRSISEEVRPLRTDEFLSICFFLEVDPMIFRNTGQPNRAS